MTFYDFYDLVCLKTKTKTQAPSFLYIATFSEGNGRERNSESPG